MIVAPAGMRKTSSMQVAKNILQDLDLIQLAPDAITREELIRQMAKTGKKNIEDLTEPISDMCIMATEAATILNKDQAKLLDDLLPLYDCPRKWSYETKNSGRDRMENAFMHIMGATTPEQLGKVLPEKVTGSGLLSRFVSIYYDRLEKIVTFPGEIRKNDEGLSEIELYLAQLRSIRGEIKLTDSFKTLYAEWRPKQHKELNQKQKVKLSYYINRRPIHLLKIAMLCAVMRFKASKDKLELIGEDFSYARSLLRETETQMDKSYQATGLSEQSALKYKVQKYLEEVDSIDFNQLFKYFMSDMDQKTLTNIISDLRKAGLVELVIGERNYDIIWKR
jgi:DNA-binding transcriptional ArsR family regulator